MKKILLGAASLTLLVAAASCTKETVDKPASDNQIAFQSYLGKQSKATETNLDILKAGADELSNGIPIVAYKDDASTTAWNTFSLFWENSAWTYGVPVVQPGFSLAYFSWWPAGAVTLDGSSTAAAGEFTYAVPTASQVDLLVANKAATLEAAIDLTYSHALSQVNFAVQEVENFQVEITNITLMDINSTSTYTFGSGWGTRSVPESYAYTLPTPTVFPTDLGTGIVSLGSGSATDANALMLMPQGFDASSTACIEVKFKLLRENYPTTGNTLYYVGEAGTSETATAYLSNYGTFTWAPGKRYVYLLDFTNYLVDRFITFTVDVDDWVNYDDEGEDTAILAVEVAQASKTAIEGAIASLAAYEDEHYDAIHITVNGAPTDDIILEIDSEFSGDKIVIYFKNGLGGKAITATGWSVNTSGSTVTLTK